MHACCARELVAIGWVMSFYPEPDEPPDCVCPHYAALCEAAGD